MWPDIAIKTNKHVPGYVTWDVPLRELELHRKTLGERDIHAVRLANPIVWKSTAMAREQKSQEWLTNLCQEPDKCEGRRLPWSVADEKDLGSCHI